MPFFAVEAMGKDTVVVELAEVRKGLGTSFTVVLERWRSWWRWWWGLWRGGPFVGGGVDDVERGVERVEERLDTGGIAVLARDHPT